MSSPDPVLQVPSGKRSARSAWTFVIVLTLTLHACSPPPPPPEPSALEQSGEVLEAALAYREREGDYPPSRYSLGPYERWREWRDWDVEPCPVARGFRMRRDSLEFDKWAEWEYPEGRVLTVALRAEAMILHAKLDDFAVANGRFPATLEEVGVSSTWGQHGPWDYAPPGLPATELGVVTADGSLTPRGEAAFSVRLPRDFQPVLRFSPGRWVQR